MDPHEALRLALGWARRRDYRGHDPYDALLSPLVRALSFGLPPLRIAWTQLLKLLPFNPRPVLFIPRTENPKALALFLWASSLIGEREEGGRLAHRLLGLQTPEGGWGYPFPWQSRAFYLPPHTPTAVNTAFGGLALLRARRLLGLTEALEGAERAGRFILTGLNRHRNQGVCFSYTPLDRHRVHNASLLAGWLLAELGERDLALEAARFARAHQRPDGSWPYGEGEAYFNYIDQFHTGFNLLALWGIARATGEDWVMETARRGYLFWRSALWEGGLPAWRLGKLHPIDTHSLAVAVLVELVFGGDAEGLARRMVSLMMDRDGGFIFRIYRKSKNTNKYMRWSQAWASLALAGVVANRAEPGLGI